MTYFPRDFHPQGVARAGCTNEKGTRRVAPNEKQGKEILCRYILRPPLANERLHLMEDGSVTGEFKRPWSEKSLRFPMRRRAAALFKSVGSCGLALGNPFGNRKKIPSGVAKKRKDRLEDWNPQASHSFPKKAMN